MIEVRRPDAFRTEQPGIVSHHVFSAGPHYDPANLSYGPVIACDLHVVDAGAGFDWHAHRGVVIVSWVLTGTLRHEDSSGEVRTVGPGGVLVQSTGGGVRHTETNASGTQPLRFVQTTLLVDAEVSVGPVAPPAVLPGGAMVRIASSVPTTGQGFAVDLDDHGVLVVEFAGDATSGTHRH